MSVCLEKDNYTFTLAGGHPGGEDLTAQVFLYTLTGLVEYSMETYDPATDSEFVFTPGPDGVYVFKLSGLITTPALAKAKSGKIK